VSLLVLIAAFVVLKSRVSCTYLQQVYLRCARKVTFFRHFLTYFSDILANESWGLAKKRSGEGKSIPYHATPYYASEPMRVIPLASVASYLENANF